MGAYDQQRVKTARATYDFQRDGGAIGDVVLSGGGIPKGATITDVLIRVKGAVTSGGAATVALKAESAADLQAAAAVSGAPWSTTGSKRGSLTATATPKVTTASRKIVATIAAAALTAGKFEVLVTYLP